jgi:hypothetical protein
VFFLFYDPMVLQQPQQRPYNRHNDDEPTHSYHRTYDCPHHSSGKSYPHEKCKQ